MKDGRIQILLVEDNSADVRLMREAMRERGIANDLHVAGDGDTALGILRGEIPLPGAAVTDLVVLDLNLPRRGGLELLPEMRSDERLKVLPVVVLTTSTSETDVYEAYRRGANCYIVKPVDFAQFRNVVTAIEQFWLCTARLPLTVAP